MGKWIKQFNGYIKEATYEIAFSQIEEIWNILLHNANAYLTSSIVMEDETNKQKGEKSFDYVARLSNIQPQKTDASHYSHPIDIVLPNGNPVKGIIRISNHIANLNTWAKENPGYDFGISIVIGKEDSIIKPTEPDNCIIHIFEYVLNDTYTEKVRILRTIADKICDIKKNGFKVSPTFLQMQGIDRTNGEPLLEDIIKRMVREEITKILNENKHI